MRHAQKLSGLGRPHRLQREIAPRRSHGGGLGRPDTVAIAAELLEARVVLAAPPAPLLPPIPLLDPKSVPQFVNQLPNPLTQLTPYVPTGVDANGFAHYEIGASLLPKQDLGLGMGRLTDVFAYGSPGQGSSYPGRTLEVQKGTPISVTWNNQLPAQHVVPIDPTVLHGVEFNAPAAGADPRTGSITGGVPAVPHLHGGHTDAVYDGTPMQWWNAGGLKGHEYQTDTFVYANDQSAATLWYHDHAMGVTRLNAYAGMAGFYLIRDGQDTGKVDNPMGLPAGDHEVPIAIQDKQFLADGSLWFPAEASPAQANVASTLPEMFGDVVLANGKAWPNLDVQPERYRLRLLNGSDSRFYTMSLQTVTNAKTGAVSNAKLPIWQIGTDTGFLNAAVPLTQLTLGPGERADVIVDFTSLRAGTKFIMTNNARSPFPGGTPVARGLTDRVMMFTVVAPDAVADPSTAPANLTNLRGADVVPAPPAVAPAPDNQVALYETLDALGRVTPFLGDVNTSKPFVDGFDSIPAVIDPATGQIKTTQVWEIYNTTADAHPIHLHQVQFQVLSRQAFKANVVPTTLLPDGTQMLGIQPGSIVLKGAAAVPTGSQVAYKDTIQIMPGEVITIRATWDLPGRYVWHCHILSHEEHDMMRFFQVGDVAYPEPRYTYTPAPAMADHAAIAPLFSTFGTARIGVGDVIGRVAEDTLAGDAADDVVA